jgi:flavin-dependent dehydrogenase
MSEQKKNAIVIGGSIAGLVAARVLLKHFQQVTLIERDHYPQGPVFRPGIPQSRQIHTTLLRGQYALEQLFPGLKTKLLAHGAIERDYGNESYYFYGGPCPRIPPVLHGWNCSRLLLEWQIRQELNAYSSQLKIIEGHEVFHLRFEENSNAVIGVKFRDRNQTKSDIEELPADLVVDASGSSSHASRWLEDLGYEAPSEEIVTANLGYATGVYEPHAGFRPEWKGIAIQATGQPPRGGILMEIEHGHWMIVLSGSNRDYPPTNEQNFLDFAGSLPDPTLHHALLNATLKSKIYGYRYAENRLRHFERLRRQPEGFVVIGDAICNFNPLYGQGMTIAVLEAMILDTCLQKGMQKSFAHTFQKKVARGLVMPWMQATAVDRRGQAQMGGVMSNLSRRYMDALIALLPKDQMVFLTFLEVVHMLRHPGVLFSPPIMLKVLTKKH